ncbi:MAG: helix-turn-helix domain-containing protein, partial [Muribaculaceae bacterium]|nr:helix-turn-helix domain-containing protein [Muribaculaceae bacterium]
ISIVEISKTIGKSQSWTCILCKHLNIKPNKDLRIKTQLETLFAQGKSAKEVAEILHRSLSTIYNYKNKFKL